MYKLCKFLIFKFINSLNLKQLSSRYRNKISNDFIFPPSDDLLQADTKNSNLTYTLEHSTGAAQTSRFLA